MRVALKVDDCSHRERQVVLVFMLECLSYGERDRKECFKNVNARDICFRLRSADLCMRERCAARARTTNRSENQFATEGSANIPRNKGKKDERRDIFISK